MILVRDLPTALGMDLNFYEHAMIGRNGPQEGCSAPMVDINDYDFKSSTDKIIKPEEYFINF